ncbi:MAG: HAD-IB family phosphatase [Bdellovibrionales bacterium]
MQSYKRDSVATIIAGDGHTLSGDLANLLLRDVRGRDAEWLCEERALDIKLGALSYEDELLTRMKLSESVGLYCDFLVQPSAGRGKKVYAFDVESTVVKQEFSNVMAELIGVKDQVDPITDDAMHNRIDFDTSVRLRSRYFAGQSVELFDRAAQGMTLMPGAKVVCDTTKALFNSRIILVSGGFNPFASLAGHRLGAHEVYANTYEIQDGVLTGGVIEPILGPFTKLEILGHEARRLGISLSQFSFTGDGGNDRIALTGVQAAGGLGLAFGKKTVWDTVDIPRLKHYSSLAGLLYFSGVRRDQFVINAAPR